MATVSEPDVVVAPPVQEAPSEVKVALGEEKSAALVIPAVYAAYVDDKSIHLVDPKKSPNSEFITYLLDVTLARFTARFPTHRASLSVKMTISAQVQLIMLARILSISAMSAGLSSISYGTVASFSSRFHLSSVEHDAWAWFAGATGPDELCASRDVNAIPAELLAIADKFIAAEEAATGAHLGSTRGDKTVDRALFAIVDQVSKVIFDFWAASVDLEGKTSIRLGVTDVSGVLRLFNHGRIPAQSQFFTELGTFGSNFEAIKRGIKAKAEAAKPKTKAKATRKKAK